MLAGYFYTESVGKFSGRKQLFLYHGFISRIAQNSGGSEVYHLALIHTFLLLLSVFLPDQLPLTSTFCFINHLWKPPHLTTISLQSVHQQGG
jgi:hypothetical protein